MSCPHVETSPDRPFPARPTADGGRLPSPYRGEGVARLGRAYGAAMTADVLPDPRRRASSAGLGELIARSLGAA